MEHKRKKFELKDLISNDKKSIQYFSYLIENEKRLCPKCRNHVHYNLKSNRYWCKDCRYNFNEFTTTYLAKIKLKTSLITNLLLYFALGYPAYRISDMDCDLSTIERTFRLFRQILYNTSLVN